MKFSANVNLAMISIRQQGCLAISKDDPAGFASYTRGRRGNLGVNLDQEICRQISDSVLDGRPIELEFNYCLPESQEVIEDVLGLF